MPVTHVSGQSIFHRIHSSSAAARPPLVLIHGAGGTLLNWPPRLRRLPGRTVLAPDLPGHGQSAGPVCTTIAGYAHVLTAWLDALGEDRVVLGGHSMGGAIALQIALQNPDRVAGLVLAATGARLPVAPALLTGLQERPAETVDHLIELLFGSQAPAVLVEIYRAELAALSPQLLYDDFLACDGFDVRADLSAPHPIREIPTLILCGREDRMTPPAYSDDLQRQLTGSRLQILPHAGHMLMLEEPDTVTTQVATFLAG